MILSKRLTICGGMLLVASMGVFVGCQKERSGADIIPTVTIKASSGGAADTGATSTDSEGDDGESSTTSTASSGGNAGGIGSLKGQVTIDGAFEPLAPLYGAGAEIKDASVCAAQAIPNQVVVTNENGGLANVFIYLEKTPDGAEVADVSADAVPFDQKGCVFIPHAMVVRAGQTITVLNDDGVAHNTHTYPTRSTGFNSLVAANDRVGIPMKYGKGEKIPVQVKCDIHPWMVAYQLPLDHSFAAVTDAEGNFEITGLPAGTHEFRVWHEKMGYVERAYKVTINGDEATEVKLTVGAAKLASFDGDAPKIVNISR